MVLDLVSTDILEGESDAWDLIIYEVVAFPMFGPDIGYVNQVFIWLWMIMHMFQVMIHIWNIDHETLFPDAMILYCFLAANHLININ